MSGLPGSLSGLRALASLVETAPGVAMWYEQWNSAPQFPAAEATAVAQTGAIPEITWEPWNPADGIEQPAYSLSAIVSGAYDRYIIAWAQEIKQWGGEIKLRFAQEMNGDWYPWDEGVNGNAPGSYVAAWRHVYGLFESVGTDNVIWVWSPNVSYNGSIPMDEVWPGSAYVDEVALDGYNWGTLHPETGWQSFLQIFGPSIREIIAITNKPLYIGEVASTEEGGSKAQWIANMFTALQSLPQIRGFVWFDWDKETNWQIDSSRDSLNAFRSGVAEYNVTT